MIKKHFWLLSVLKTVQFNIFVETVIHLFFQDSLMNRKYIYLKPKSYVTLIFVFVTFDQFKESLMNKSINFFQIILTDPRTIVLRSCVRTLKCLAPLLIHLYLFVIDVLPVQRSEETVSHDFLCIIRASSEPSENKPHIIIHSGLTWCTVLIWCSHTEMMMMVLVETDTPRKALDHTFTHTDLLLGSLMSNPDSKDLASAERVLGNLISSIRISSNSFSWSWRP